MASSGPASMAGGGLIIPQVCVRITWCFMMRPCLEELLMHTKCFGEVLIQKNGYFHYILLLTMQPFGPQMFVYLTS